MLKFDLGSKKSTPVSVRYKDTLQLSRGNICVANFIPPVNGGCLDNYLDQKCDFILKHSISSKSRLDPAVVAW